MPRKLEQHISHFLREHGGSYRRIGIGLSGGPDSMALLHGLLRVRKLFSLELHILHVDHAWRSESRAEAETLRQLATSIEIPFHSSRLEEVIQRSNLEDVAREARRSLFLSWAKEHSLDAVALGHHADDQAETVLKRLFEGASLSALTGICPVSHHDSLVLWRPLLTLSRREIMEYVDAQKLEFFTDSTNEDPRFLRSRCRQTLIPLLSNTFGKEVSSSLCKLGESAARLTEYLDRRIASALDSIVHTDGSLQIVIDRFPDEHVEREHLLRRLLQRMNTTLPATLLHEIASAEPGVNRTWRTGKIQITLGPNGLVVAVLGQPVVC